MLKSYPSEVSNRAYRNCQLALCWYGMNRNNVLLSYTLWPILPPISVASQNYHLRQRKHSLELPCKTNYLMNSNFIQRMLYLDSY